MRPISVTPTVWVRARQGPNLADLISAPGKARAMGDSDVIDVLGSAYAATDGDRQGRPQRTPVVGGQLDHGVLAEGGANYWDAFQLLPCSRGFWLDGLHFDVFPVRHHQPNSAFGLALPGSFVYTGDTRPIPEQLSLYADELIAHDCGLHGNPSHSGIDDLVREYPPDLLARCVFYHYASAADGEAMRGRGHRVAAPGEVLTLPAPASGIMAVQ